MFTEQLIMLKLPSPVLQIIQYDLKLVYKYKVYKLKSNLCMLDISKLLVQLLNMVENVSLLPFM